MAGVREKLLTASDLAALCEVDLKTIHNWVDRGRIAHFRTPGRHLRFRAADVAEFLRAWGYSVPRELARGSSRTVLVVGSRDTVAHVTRALGEGLPSPDGAAGKPRGSAEPIRHAAHPYDALVFAGSDPADVYVIDLREVEREIDVGAMLEALHRASAEATLVLLADHDGGSRAETRDLPPFVARVGRTDAQALRALVLPGEPSVSPGLAPDEAPRVAAAR